MLVLASVYRDCLCQLAYRTSSQMLRNVIGFLENQDC